MPDPATRSAAIARFLAATPAADWSLAPMAGDASARRFFRLLGPGEVRLILMDADPATGEDLAPFLRIAAHLRDAGLAAPAIIAADPAAGLAVVEDLGPDHVTAWLARHPQDESVIYAAATDLLVRLHSIPSPAGLTLLTPDHGAAMLGPFFDHFCTGRDAAWRAQVAAAMRDAIATHAPVANTLSLRDFHAENLIWRPWLTGDDRLGLIDFQDAMVTPAAYDLASLLRDARRDVDPGVQSAMIARFASGTGQGTAQVQAACATLAVQRNLRILGIFSRLAAMGKPRYLDLIPRVLAMLEGDLHHHALAVLAPLVLPALEPPR